MVGVATEINRLSAMSRERRSKIESTLFEAARREAEARAVAAAQARGAFAGLSAAEADTVRGQIASEAVVASFSAYAKAILGDFGRLGGDNAS